MVWACEEYVGRRMMRLMPPGKRWQGRPKKRWSDCVEEDMKEKGADKKWIHDRLKW